MGSLSQFLNPQLNGALRAAGVPLPNLQELAAESLATLGENNKKAVAAKLDIVTRGYAYFLDGLTVEKMREAKKLEGKLTMHARLETQSRIGLIDSKIAYANQTMSYFQQTSQLGPLLSFCGMDSMVEADDRATNPGYANIPSDWTPTAPAPAAA